MNSTATELTVAAWPWRARRGCCDSSTGTEDHADYAGSGGYQRLDDPDALLDQVDLSGLLGQRRCGVPDGNQAAHRPRRRSPRSRDRGRRQRRRGRARFGEGPLAAAQSAAPGARRAAAGGADRRCQRAHTCTCRMQHAATAVESALGELAAEVFGETTVHVVTVEPGYVAGEETAAVRVINGGPAKPTDKPPRPFEEGVGGAPTLVSNVETLANLPYIHAHGAAELPVGGYADVAGHLPGHRHRRRDAQRRCTRSRTAHRFPSCLALHGLAADAVTRRADGWLLRGPAEHARSSTSRSTTRRFAGSAAGSAAARSPS